MIRRRKTRKKYKRREMSPEEYGVDLSRDEEMLALYRRGLTLQKIGDKFGITRSRSQQIVARILKRKIRQSLRHHKIQNPERKPIKVLVKEEIEKIRDRKRVSWLEKRLTVKAQEGIVPEKFTSEARFALAVGINLGMIRRLAPDVTQAIRENQTIGHGGLRWSKFYLKCRMCGTISIRHRSSGYCMKCYPKTQHFKELQEASRLRNQHRWKERQLKYFEEYYDRKYFGGNRLRVLRRDGFKCRRCLMTNKQSQETYGKRLRVIHLRSKTDNRLYNLATVCRGCALKVIQRKRSFIGKSIPNSQDLLA